jgi:hypothetical protein
MYFYVKNILYRHFYYNSKHTSEQAHNQHLAWFSVNFFFFLRDIQHMLFAYFMSMIAEKLKGRKTEWQIIGRLKIWSVWWLGGEDRRGKWIKWGGSGVGAQRLILFYFL